MNDQGQKLTLHLAIARGRIEEVNTLVKNTKEMEVRLKWTYTSTICNTGRPTRNGKNSN